MDIQRQELFALFEPETKPAIEYVRGRMLQKMNPQYSHALLQGRWFSAIDAWRGARGGVGTEWRFYFAPPDASWGSLVPDVGYLSPANFDALTPEQRERPTIAPDVAIEILSPDDRPLDVDWKIAAYLYGGTQLVVVVDPPTRTLVAHDPSGMRAYDESQTFEHAALPGFQLVLATLFEGVYRG